MTEISKSTALKEIVFLFLLFIAFNIALDGIDLWIFMPGSLWIVVACLIIFAFQKQNGQGLRGLGIRKPESWSRAVLVFVGTLALIALIAIFLLPVLIGIFGEPSPLPLFEHTGVPFFFIWLRVMLTAAFGEEIIFRGFLIPRLEAVFASSKYATHLAIAVHAVLFTVPHYPSGMANMAAVFLISFVLGYAFIFGKRNLWPLFFVHAVPDTISMLSAA